MKNKILTLTVLTLALAFTINVYAISQSSGAETGIQELQQAQTANQAEDSQLQTQAKEQVQTQTQDNTSNEPVQTQTQAQVQAQTQINANTETQVQNQNQNQIENQNEKNQIQNAEQQQQEIQSQTRLDIAEQRKSQIANAAQEILQTAKEIQGTGENNDIGLQVRSIAQVQVQNQEKLEDSLQKVESRSTLAKFFIGPDYNEINNAKKILEENRLRIQELNELKNQLSNEGDQQSLTQQAQTIEQVNLQVENSLNASQKGFSLFGWLVKLFD